MALRNFHRSKKGSMKNIVLQNLCDNLETNTLLVMLYDYMKTISLNRSLATISKGAMLTGRFCQPAILISVLFFEEGLSLKKNSNRQKSSG